MTAKVEAFGKEDNPDLSVFLGDFPPIIGIWRKIVDMRRLFFEGCRAKKGRSISFYSLLIEAFLRYAEACSSFPSHSDRFFT